MLQTIERAIQKARIYLYLSSFYDFVEMVNYCLALPYLPGGAELGKKFAQENGNTKQHDEFYRIAGISREHVWIQRVRQAVVLLILKWLV
ncbi:MAG TPA: hypothetical protein VKA09_11175 [Nitrososphaeraceae archaeon]|nr:hypothetical protein [Nitrososphaeraceae archaeon]